MSGRRAYEAYCQSAKWVSKYTGAPLPEWCNVDDDTKTHWDAVATSLMGDDITEMNRKLDFITETLVKADNTITTVADEVKPTITALLESPMLKMLLPKGLKKNG